MSNFYKNFFIIISEIGSVEIVLALIIIFSFLSFFYYKERFFTLFVISQFSITFFIVYVLKEIIEKSRPVDRLINESGYAFPSGHAAVAVSVFLIIFYFSKNFKKHKKYFWRMVGIIWILLTVTARLYLKVHDIYDILGSFIIAYFVYYFITNFLTKHFFFFKFFNK